MNIKTIFLTTLIFFGCTTDEKNQASNEQKTSIVGVWEIKSVVDLVPRDLSPSAFEPLNDSVLSLTQTFGVLAIHESKGKSVEFTQDSNVISNLIDPAKLKEFDFRYSYTSKDSLITFSMVNPKDNSKIYMPTKTYFEDSYMFWKVDGFTLIKLGRVN